MSIMKKVLLLKSSSSTSSSTTTTYQISITIYNAQQKQYPKSKQEWDEYDGIIITGSLSAAYDNKNDDHDADNNNNNNVSDDNDDKNWIQYLMDEIQCNIHPFQRKTIGVCFGHQVFAHSFEKKKKGSHVDNNNDDNDYGLAVKCPKGIQVGLREFESLPLLLPKKDNSILGSSQNKTRRTSPRKIKMLYTHGDMVQSIPHCALSLGGNNDIVPIQACAYFASSGDKKKLSSFIISTRTIATSRSTFAICNYISRSSRICIKRSRSWYIFEYIIIFRTQEEAT